LGIYVFKDAEIVDFAAPHGVFSVARRYDPELDAFLIADAMRPVQTQGYRRGPRGCQQREAGAPEVVEPDVRSDAAADPGPAALEGKDLKPVVLEDEVAAGGVERISCGLKPSRCGRLRGDWKLSCGGLIARAFEDRRAPETLASAARAFGYLVLSFERDL